jgi:UDP-glucose 4-epimerase
MVMTSTSGFNRTVASRLNAIGMKEVSARTRTGEFHGKGAVPSGRILITGGAGNVGSNLSLALKGKGFDVFALDNLSKGHKQACDIVGVPLIEADLEDFDAVRSALADVRPDAVIHAASYIEVGESSKDPHKYISGNILGGMNLFRAMQEAGVSRLLFSNTAAVYDGTLNKALTEEDPTRPASVYGSTKAFLGRILREGQHFPDIQTISLHYFNVFGAQGHGFLREDHGILEESHLIPIAMQVAIYNMMLRCGLELPGYDTGEILSQYAGSAASAGREQIKLFGSDFDTQDGTCVRDYISMDTMIYYHMQAIRRLLTGPNAANYEVYNLGTKTGRSVLQVLDSVEDTVVEARGYNVPDDVVRDDTLRLIPIVREGRRAGDVGFLVADPSKARTVFGAPDNIGFDRELERTFWSMIYRPMGYAARPAVESGHPVLEYYGG